MGGVSQAFFDDYSNKQWKSTRVIDVTHSANHEGRLFTAGKVHLNVADNAYCSVSLVNTNRHELAITWSAQAEGKALLDVFTEVDLDGTETELTVYNFNKYPSAPSTVVTAYEAHTVDSWGNQTMPQELILGGTGPQSTGAGHEPKYEIILPSGRSMTVRVQNVSGQAKDVGVNLRWSEIDRFNFTTTTSTTTSSSTTTTTTA